MQLFRQNPEPARTVTLTKRVGPAVSRTTIAEKATVDFTKRFDKAGLALTKRGIDIHMDVAVVLDHSGSMNRDYTDGTVQALVERVLAFALNVDADGQVPVIRFDNAIYPAITVQLDNYRDIAATSLYEPYKMTGTTMAPPLKSLIQLAKDTPNPLMVFVIGDGQPEDLDATTQIVQKLSSYPIFLKFLAIRPIAFLEHLDDMDGRTVDNADTKFIPNPTGMTDLDFADAMTDELDTWITAATAAGILRTS